MTPNPIQRRNFKSYALFCINPFSFVYIDFHPTFSISTSLQLISYTPMFFHFYFYLARTLWVSTDRATLGNMLKLCHTLSQVVIFYLFLFIPNFYFWYMFFKNNFLDWVILFNFECSTVEFTDFSFYQRILWLLLLLSVVTVSLISLLLMTLLLF